jgi:hypothetical protein
VGLGRAASGAAPLRATRADAEGKTQLLEAGPAPAKRRSVLPLALGALVLVGAGGVYALFGHHSGTVAPETPSTDAPPDTARPPAPTGERPSRPSIRPAVAGARIGARLNDWFDRIDALDGVTLRDSAKAAFDTPGVAAKDRALAAYLVANAYAKLDDRAHGCEWARRAASLDAAVRSYPALVQSLCQP